MTDCINRHFEIIGKRKLLSISCSTSYTTENVRGDIKMPWYKFTLKIRIQTCEKLILEKLFHENQL